MAEKAGASLRLSTRVERVEGGPGGVTGVVLAGGERLAAGDVVVTSDLPAAYAHLLPPAARDWRVQRRRLHWSPSCYLVHLGLTRQLEGQAHHTVHLGRDWKATFEALTRRGGIQPDPSLLVTYPSPEDPEAAPPGHATLFVLEPTANTRAGLDWAETGPRLRERLYGRLAGLGYGDLRRDSAVELVVDPPAWEAQGLSAGTPFSLDHRFSQTGWLRPQNASAGVPGLVFAGMGTVPGVGVPMVLISGRLAAERVLARGVRGLGQSGSPRSLSEPRHGAADPGAAYERCRQLHARHGRTYYLATLLLPRWKRRHVHALYGFTRYADEIVDDLSTRPWTGPARRPPWQAWGERFFAGLRGQPCAGPDPAGRAPHRPGLRPGRGRLRAVPSLDGHGPDTSTATGPTHDLLRLHGGLGGRHRDHDGPDPGVGRPAGRRASTPASSAWPSS